MMTLAVNSSVGARMTVSNAASEVSPMPPRSQRSPTSPTSPDLPMLVDAERGDEYPNETLREIGHEQLEIWKGEEVSVIKAGCELETKLALLIKLCHLNKVDSSVYYFADHFSVAMPLYVSRNIALSPENSG